VTLSAGALAACDRLHVNEMAVRRARARPVSEHERPMYLVVQGELEDGRTVSMSCQHDRPWHVLTFNLVS
jgi:hypothetical protein